MILSFSLPVDVIKKKEFALRALQFVKIQPTFLLCFVFSLAIVESCTMLTTNYDH